MSEIEIVSQGEVDVEEMDLVHDEDTTYVGVEDPGQMQAGEDAEIDAMLDAEESEASGVPAIEEFVESEPEGGYENRSTGFEWALEQIIATNSEAIEQKARVKEAQAKLKDEKETLESIQDNLNRLILEAAKLKSQGEPDPDKFPLFDREKPSPDKLEINGLFAKPEAIQPLPADTYQEFCRREQVGTRFDSLPGLKPATVKALAEAGLVTVADFVRKSDALVEANASMTTIKGISEKRLDEITDALVVLTSSWLEKWTELHPEPEVPEPAAESGAAE